MSAGSLTVRFDLRLSPSIVDSHKSAFLEQTQNDDQTYPTTTMKFAAAFLLSSLAAVSAYDVPSLTPANYDDMTDGKTVFIKFFAPWVRTTGFCVVDFFAWIDKDE